ncbi:MAG: hypothetical protein U0798_04930 [Gemmataceae bacterium]
MPFATRCPECRVKLRLENAPEAGETVECPKCGSTFIPDAPADEDRPRKSEERSEDAPPRKKKKKKKEKASAAPGSPRKRVAKKKKSNPVLLFGGLGAALVFVVLVSIFAIYFFGRAGNVEEMLTYVPGDCNIARGVNVSQMNKFSGFAGEMDVVITGQVKTLSNDLAVATGMADGEDVMDYLVIGKVKKKDGAGTVYVFRTRKPFSKPNPLSEAPSMSAQDMGGTTAYRSNGKDLLAGAYVFTPTNRLIVVIPKSSQQQSMASAVAAGGLKNREQTFGGKTGDTGKRVSKGHIWTLIRPDDALEKFAKDMGDSVKSSFPAFATACEKTKAIGWWTSYSGSYIYFGGAVDCNDSTGSYELKKAMNDGELGKQDDATIPNDMKKAVSQSGSKDFTEFLAWLKFNYTGSAGFFTAKMTVNNGKQYTRIFNNPSVAGWADDSGGGGNSNPFGRSGAAAGGGGGRPLPGGN